MLSEVDPIMTERGHTITHKPGSLSMFACVHRGQYMITRKPSSLVCLLV